MMVEHLLTLLAELRMTRHGVNWEG